MINDKLIEGKVLEVVSEILPLLIPAVIAEMDKRKHPAWVTPNYALEHILRSNNGRRSYGRRRLDKAIMSREIEQRKDGRIKTTSIYKWIGK